MSNKNFHKILNLHTENKIAIEMYVSFQWALLNVRCRYRRSSLGPFWETLSTLILILGITVVYSSIFSGSVNEKTIVFIGIGVSTWSLLSSFFIDGSTLFIDTSSLLKNSTLKKSIIIRRKLFEIIIIFAHISLLFLVGIAFGICSFSIYNFLFIPGIFLISIFGFYTITIFSYLCARFRDLIMIIRNFLQLMFFVTPVFWNPNLIKSERIFLVELNPFHHLISLLREPLLGTTPSLISYAWALGLIFLAWITALLIKIYFSKNIALVL